MRFCSRCTSATSFETQTNEYPTLPIIRTLHVPYHDPALKTCTNAQSNRCVCKNLTTGRTTHVVGGGGRVDNTSIHHTLYLNFIPKYNPKTFETIHCATRAFACTSKKTLSHVAQTCHASASSIKKSYSYTLPLIDNQDATQIRALACLPARTRVSHQA